MTDQDRADLYRAMRHAFSHDRPGGPHDDRNVHAFLNALERFIDEKVDERLRQVATTRPLESFK